MLKIEKNIEDNAYYYKEWYKEMNNLVGENFDTTDNFKNSVAIGQKIHFDVEDPILPNGITIPGNSNITLEKLSGKTFEVLEISQTGNLKTIKVGIRSTDISG